MKMESMGKPERPHAVCLPFPAQGHINPMMRFAVLLHHRGFHITFVYTEYNHSRLLKSRGATAVEGLPDFQFRTIPDGLSPGPGGSANATQDVQSLCLSTRANCLRPFTQVINDLNGHSTPDVPPVTCVVADAIMTIGLEAAEEIDVPGVLLRTSNACSFMCYKHIKHLVAKGFVPFPDDNCVTNLEAPIDWVPGIIPLRLKDFPSFIRTTDPNDPMLDYVITEIDRTSMANVIIENTFEELECKVLNALTPVCPPIFTVGPLHLMVKQLNNDKYEWMSSSLLKEDSTCLKWLDSKQPSSVIYVNFGSIAVLNSKQLSEFAWGLVESKQNFLWVIRPDLVQGENAALPPEFWDETSGRGFVTAWCLQEEVLVHPAVGGFLTHCGWNSVMESLCSGVPLLCWPFFADQHINCRYACEEWEIGMEINSDVKRDELGSLVKELMDGEKGKMMRQKAMEWKKKAAEAIAPGGSSYSNLDKLVKEVLTT